MTNEEAIKILKNEYMCRIKINSCHISGKGCVGCEYDENNDIVTQAINYAVQALSKQSASCKQADQCGNDTEMVDQFREDTKKTDSERVSLPQPEKSNSFSKESPEEVIHEMNCSDVPDIRVGKTDFKPGDKFILELGEERNRFGDFRIKGTDLDVETYLLKKLTRYEP